MLWVEKMILLRIKEKNEKKKIVLELKLLRKINRMILSKALVGYVESFFSFGFVIRLLTVKRIHGQPK